MSAVTLFIDVIGYFGFRQIAVVICPQIRENLAATTKIHGAPGQYRVATGYNHPTVEPGSKLGQYEILSSLGAGGIHTA